MKEMDHLVIHIADKDGVTVAFDSTQVDDRGWTKTWGGTLKISDEDRKWLIDAWERWRKENGV